MSALSAASRPPSGKGGARKTRAAGRIPAVVYGRGRQAETIAVDPYALGELFKTTGNRNTIVQLEIDGAKAVPCLVRDVQRHPVSRALLHVDFYAVPETPIEIMIPVKTIGRPKGLLLGGHLRLVRRTLKAVCTYDRIPDALTVDVSELDVDQFMNISQIPVPDGVRLVYDRDFPVVNVYGKSKIKEDLPEDKPKEPTAEQAAEAAAQAAEAGAPAEPAAE
jgi:large subunit ribosomal protein L25